MTGGKPSVEGPLALKGELRETQKRLDSVEAELARAEMSAASLARLIGELATQAERISEERRNAERESANQSAALRQMDAEVARLERRLNDWVVQSERNKDLRGVRQALIEEKREEVSRVEAEHAAAEGKVNEQQQNMEELRRQRDEVRRLTLSAMENRFDSWQLPCFAVSPDWRLWAVSLSPEPPSA